MNRPPNWDNLPALVLTEIFSYLDHNNKLVASSTCWNWRSVLFQPRLLKSLQFNLDLITVNESKCKFFLENLAHIIPELTISINYLYNEEITTKILKRLTTNQILFNLMLITNYNEEMVINFHQSETLIVLLNCIKTLLQRTSPPMRSLNLGGCEILNHYAGDMLHWSSAPEKITLLGLGSVPHTNYNSIITPISFNFFEKFQSLQILSINYAFLTDDYLKALENLPLRKLMMHVTKPQYKTTNTTRELMCVVSDTAWISFRKKNPSADLYLTLLFTQNLVYELHNTILTPNMKLSHLRVLFCCFINPFVMDYLAEFYGSTLKSLMWIDCVNTKLSGFVETDLDSLVMMSWKCHKLSEIVIYGYAMEPHNLVGISRLRGTGLKNLEIFMYDYDRASIKQSLIEEISTQLNQKWSPVINPHPGVCGFNDMSYRTEFILDLLRNDMK